ncbi:DUF7706 family protein [Cupriavidus consociatus]|uniref:DUF7706 family protein n=1 Tax=Cupriavidus consociatus TaxID=2821357 RepID=UPI001AE4A9F2|nr:MULTISPECIES: hypothetical protein [unclassified Cupriavidus]MBP0623683.1 hypothetical protein [Cupriavidus sp. LEh25]MDK2660387.1 hypothetical protein [Cupriavidus sp. LEh21]
MMAATIQLHLDHRRTAALSKLLQSVTWSDLSAYAHDVEEAFLMRDALDTIGRAVALGDAGRSGGGLSGDVPERCVNSRRRAGPSGRID